MGVCGLILSNSVNHDITETVIKQVFKDHLYREVRLHTTSPRFRRMHGEHLSGNRYDMLILLTMDTLASRTETSPNKYERDSKKALLLT